MIGRIIDGRYRIQSLLAIGGMGRVYKAEQSGLGRTVAIKILTADPARQARDPLFRERFAREAAMASRLTSPNTITIFHHGRTDDDIYYIVMEYVEGVTLGHLLKREGRLSIVRAIAIAGQVCLSLREAHARGIIHRDIKPTNLILIDGDYDQVKVLDFGIAKHVIRDADEVDQELTSSGSYVGTPEYLAPESLDGQVDSRSDIYSLGVVLYRAVTGRLPFKGKTATQTLLMSLHVPAPAIDPALGVPGSLEDLIFACLEKDPERRPDSVDEVLRALQLCLGELADPARTGPIPVEAAPAAEPLGATKMHQGSKAPRSALARAKALFAASLLLSIGAIAAALIVRLSRGEREAGATVAPAAPRAPARAATLPDAPTVKALEASRPAASPAAPVAAPVAPVEVVDQAEPAADPPADAPAVDAIDKARADESERRSRRAARPRSDKRAKARHEPARSDRGAAPAGKPRPEDPVPDGYKPSPY